MTLIRYADNGPIYFAVPNLASAIRHSINRLMPSLTWHFAPDESYGKLSRGPHSNHTVSNLWRKLLTFFLLQDFKCADCGYSCKLKRDLIKHITASHSREVIFIKFIIGGTTRPPTVPFQENLTASRIGCGTTAPITRKPNIAILQEEDGDPGEEEEDPKKMDNGNLKDTPMLFTNCKMRF